MTDYKAKAVPIAVLKVLIDEVTSHDQKARAELLTRLLAAGVEKVSAELPDGTKVASVSVRGGDKFTARVVDDAAFLRYVKEHRPEEIEEKVRDSFKRSFLDELTRNQEEIPGVVELKPSMPYIHNAFKPGGQAAIKRAWYSGALTLPEVLAIESGEVPE
jgi:hypothetical protein